jgi:phage anti-repressor protein
MTFFDEILETNNMQKIYQRKCVSCKNKFTPQNNTQICCSPKCAIDYMKSKNAKDWQKEKKILKEKLMTKSDYLNICQKVFNTYIRTRDKNKNCISCNKKLIGKYDAGHFFSVGAYPNLRFNENNVFGQCVHCNRDKHGNVKEYDLKLQNILSTEDYNQLLNDRNKPALLSIDDVKELIAIYRVKTKELTNGKN